MKCLIVGSSPVMLTLAKLLSNSSNKVTIVESRRNIGGAWRIGKPFKEINQSTSIYNNIMIACSDYEANNFFSALKLIEAMGVTHEIGTIPVKIDGKNTNYPYRKINIEPLINKIVNTKEIIFKRETIKKLKINDRSVLVEGLGSFDKVYIPESIPIHEIYLPDKVIIKHKYIQSQHLHILLEKNPRNYQGKIMFKEPFSNIFDRGTLLPRDTNNKNYIHFIGRIAREYKKYRTSYLISKCDFFAKEKISNFKRYVYISSYLNDKNKSDFIKKINNSNRVEIVKTGQLVDSLLSLNKYLNNKIIF